MKKTEQTTQIPLETSFSSASLPEKPGASLDNQLNAKSTLFNYGDELETKALGHKENSIERGQLLRQSTAAMYIADIVNRDASFSQQQFRHVCSMIEERERNTSNTSSFYEATTLIATFINSCKA